MKNENALMLISSTNARMMKNVNNQMNVSFKFQAKNAGLGSLSRKEPPVFGPWEPEPLEKKNQEPEPLQKNRQLEFKLKKKAAPVPAGSQNCYLLGNCTFVTLL